MKNNSLSTFFWPSVLIVAGGLFLMRNFGLLDFQVPFRLISWKLIPLIIGINALLNHRYAQAIIPLAFAAIVYTPEFLSPAERQEFYKLWPLILVAIGIMVLINKRNPQLWESCDKTHKHVNLDAISDHQFLGAITQKIHSNHFKGGTLNCVMGGTQLDLTDADFVNNSQLKVFLMMGGLELRIPKEWQVKLDVLPIMGGVNDKISKYPSNVVNTQKTFVITGTVIMGGIEIKRY